MIRNFAVGMECLLGIATLLPVSVPASAADQNAPWGAAQPAAEQVYLPQKVVFDVAVDTPEAIDALLDRMSGLSVEYGADPFDASVVAVLHGPEMHFFTHDALAEHDELMRRAESLTVGGIIEFRMCERAAANQGIQPGDVHGFVTMVPMGDAEIVKLQQEENYAYIK
ncbi:MAG TPA: hypothetical protein VK104_02760 [Burkholderiaceae bacterium]|nr:hypothetical protein [Burkholderiaceae bacterium]